MEILDADRPYGCNLLCRVGLEIYELEDGTAMIIQRTEKGQQVLKFVDKHDAAHYAIEQIALKIGKDESHSPGHPDFYSLLKLASVLAEGYFTDDEESVEEEI